ncbi:MAG: YceI family protein [Planctomycetes bacterium]|nr:YceI family protein [Planctomycetota bacterium]
MAPQELPPEIDKPPAPGTGLIATVLPPKPEKQDPKPPDLVAAEPPDLFVEGPTQEVAASLPASNGDFFGFAVGTADRAAEPASAATLLRLRLMKGRCVGGFDGKSSVLDFSGWTRELHGELTYEKGRLAETAKGIVTADPATIDTGDADRDKEIRDTVLETAKYPRMQFEISHIKMTALDKMDMTGVMEIHGVTKEVTLPCLFKLRRDGFAWMKGEIRLNMTEFGITPPVKMGVIKVENEIRIWFEIWAEPVKEPMK